MVAQALKDYYQEHAKHIVTAKHALYHEKRLKGHFGGFYASQVTQARVNDYIRLCQGRKESNGTIRRDLEHLKAALNHEVREQRILYAPKFKMPPAPDCRERVLTPTELKSLLKHCKTPHLRNFVILMMGTGQRPGAIEKLLWSQVDLKNRIIRFDKGKQHANKRARAVPMNQEIHSLLASLWRIKQTPFVLEFVQTNKKKGTSKSRPAGNVKKAFYRACKDAGLENVSRYTLRHTWGTMKYLEGHQDKDIADVMGHTTAKTTVKNYLHTQMDRLRLVVDSAEKVQKSQKRGKSNVR